MKRVILLSRELPLPTVSAAGHDYAYQVVKQDEAPPQHAKVLCATPLDNIDATYIKNLPSTIGLISNLGVGIDNIDLGAAASRKILVTNTPVVTEDTADLAFALLLAVARNIGRQERYVRSGNWKIEGSNNFLGARVHGKTLGLVGFGAIGQAVARRAAGFGMKTMYWNRSAKPDVEAKLNTVRANRLEDLFHQSDFISLHIPLTAETYRLIGSSQLDSCKKGAILINTARGPIVDEDALVNALASGHIAGAGLDVFENEPKIHSDLFKMDQVMLLPHIGSATTECRTDMVRCAISNIVQFLETGTARDLIGS